MDDETNTGTAILPGEDISRLTREYMLILKDCNDLALATYEARIERSMFKLQAKLKLVHKLQGESRRRQGLY